MWGGGDWGGEIDTEVKGQTHLVCQPEPPPQKKIKAEAGGSL